jgi:ArsR family transcriptional regulator, lead/cadmium/zinc/bismuth-responsive transcriptional repressor
VRSPRTEEGACRATTVDAVAIERARTVLSDDSRAARTTAMFAAFSDPTRFRILEALSSGELCVCDLAALGSVSQSAVSHQLRLLRERGLVAFRREGNRAVYRLADDHVRTLLVQGLAHADEPEATS